MEIPSNPSAQKLLTALGQFHRAKWHDYTVEGCKPSEIRVLFCIQHGATRDGSMKVSEISKTMHVTSPTITQLLKGLEANGFIERRIDPGDRRAVDISLTTKGEMVTQKAWQGFLSSLQGLIEYLGEERSDQLAELLSDAVRYYTEKAANIQSSAWNGVVTV